MEVSSLLSLPEGLHVKWIEPQGADLSIGVVSLLPSSCCPLCSQASSQVHSQYQRTLRDVPCGGRPVVLRLSVRKFFCRNPDCSRKIFTERLPPFVQPYAQVTTRLFEAVQAIGLATSGPRVGNWEHAWLDVSVCTPHPPPSFAASWPLPHALPRRCPA